MIVPARRGVTRGYVAALIVAAVFVALSLLVACWGFLAYSSGGSTVSSGRPVWLVPALVFVLLMLLAWSLWGQALTLLRGRVRPAYAQIVSVSLGSFIVFNVLGMLAGLTLSETWLSLYSACIVFSQAVSAFAFWGVLARRVYTLRPTPTWPWEKREGGV